MNHLTSVVKSIRVLGFACIFCYTVVVKGPVFQEATATFLRRVFVCGGLRCLGAPARATGRPVRFGGPPLTVVF